MALSQTAQRWLIWAGVVSLMITLRLACVLHQRNRSATPKPVVRKPIEQDSLVTIPKSYVEDFQAARQLVGRPLWVKLGYVTEYFPVPQLDQASSRSPQLFPPLEKFTVEEVSEKSIS